jgi:dihydropteroate synthase type 2
MNPKIVGIVNVTTDSFSDGGQFVESEKAIAHGQELLHQGADWLDLGAESSNPDGEKVSAAEEMARLTPVIRALKSAQLAIDTYKPEVMAHCLGLGAGMINDITALENPESIEVVKSFQVPVVLMFARNQGPRAEKQLGNPETILTEIETFFSNRIERLLKSGMREEQIILDPGMGFFLGSNPEPSLRVLQALERLKKLGRPLYVCVSRKSFIGSVLGGRPPQGREHGTLAAEIWAALQGVAYLRTHAVAPLHDALRVLQAIQM